MSIFSLLKIPILSRKLLRVGVQSQHKHFKKTLLFCDRKSNSRYKDKELHERCHIHSVHLSCTRGEFCTHAILSPVACTFRKIIRHMTSDFDVCEIDLDMQMSFLHTAPRLHLSAVCIQRSSGCSARELRAHIARGRTPWRSRKAIAGEL